MIRLIVAISLSVVIAIVLAHGVAYLDGQSGSDLYGSGVAVAQEPGDQQ